MKQKCEKCGKEHSCFSWEKRNICYSCREKEYREQIVEQVKNGEITEIDGESDIYCPHCGCVREIDDDYDLYGDGEHETYCGECDKAFIVETSVSYSFSTRRKD